MKHAILPPTTRLLILMRHGTAVATGADVVDFERVLTAEGVAECERTALELRRMNVTTDLIVSSPADRALETAHALADKLGYDYHQIQLADTLYRAATLQPVLTQVRRLDSSVSAVIICGHSPQLDDLASHLIDGFSRTIPKGGAAGISFDTSTWRGVKRSGGRPAFFVTPDTPEGRRERSPRRGRA